MVKKAPYGNEKPPLKESSAGAHERRVGDTKDAMPPPPLKLVKVW